MNRLRSLLRTLAAVMPLALLVALAPAAQATTPTITSLSPNAAYAGSAAFTLTINGTNFITGAAAKWGTTALTTTYKSATQLTAAVPATLIAAVGKASVTVTTTGGTSAASTFTIKQPPPTITSLSPNAAYAGGAAFTLTINGTNFITGAVAKWGATALTTTYKSATRLTAAVPATLIAAVGTASVTVTTTGGTSAAFTFTIKQPPPTITSLSPNAAYAGGAGFTLTINGTNFITGAVARWGATALTTTYKSETQLTAAIPATLIAAVGTASVTVTTTGGTSAAFTFTIKQPPPTITSLSPNAAYAGGAAFTLTINGTHFLTGAAAKWGAIALTTTYKSSTQLTAAVPATLIAAVGTASVMVTTAGGTSAAVTFAIKQPPPAITSLSPKSITAGSPAFTLTINGTNFITGASAKWGTTALATAYKTATLLTAPVPAALIAKPGTASVTVATTGGTSAPVTFTINPASQAKCANDGSGNAKMQGAYSFQFTQTDPSKNGRLAMDLGSFTADGIGNITAGLSDFNGPSLTSEQQAPFTGTYSIGPDDRGLLTINYTGGSTTYFCFALDSFASGVAASGRMVSDVTNVQVNSGSFYAQGAAAKSLSSVKGGWTIGLQGVKVDKSTAVTVRGATAGYLTLDGAGNVTTGEVDLSQELYEFGNFANNYQSQIGVTGTYTLAASGRGTLKLNVALNGTQNYIFYVAGPNQILLLSADIAGQGGSSVLLGKGLLRTASSFSNASLSETSVAVGQSLSNTNAASYGNRLVQVGIFTWDGKSSESESFDRNDAGVITLQQTSSGTYAVDANGRVSINGTTPATIAYLVGANQGFAVRGNLGADFLYFEKQTVPNGGFLPGSFSGAYSDGSLWYSYEQQKGKSGEIAANGAGKLTGTLDVDPLLNGTVDLFQFLADPDDQSISSLIANQTLGETYTASGSGRFVVRNGSLLTQALYFVSPNKAYAIDIDGAPWQGLEELNHQ